MPPHEHRRLANQPQARLAPKTQAEWEQLRRALLMVVAQFKATDPAGCYTLEVRVSSRVDTKTTA